MTVSYKDIGLGLAAVSIVGAGFQIRSQKENNSWARTVLQQNAHINSAADDIVVENARPSMSLLRGGGIQCQPVTIEEKLVKFTVLVKLPDQDWQMFNNAPTIFGRKPETIEVFCSMDKARYNELYAKGYDATLGGVSPELHSEVVRILKPMTLKRLPKTTPER